MTRPWRIALIVAFFASALGGGVYGAMAFVRYSPPKLDFMHAQATGKTVHLVIETVSQMGKGHTHPAWVSYWAKSPKGKWVHSTVWEVPAYSRIDVTEYNFDGGHHLRNQDFGAVTGTIGGYMHVNGKKLYMETSKTFYGESHTFTVPQLGLNVPFPSVNDKLDNFCTKAPCIPSKAPHNTITFSFMSGAPRIYHWQCIYPCAAGYLYGNGGPMDTLGYMSGFLEVLPTNSHQHLSTGG